MTDTATKPPAAENLSAQEQAIEADNLIVHGSATDRVLGLYEAIVGYGRPRVTLDRARWCSLNRFARPSMNRW